MVTNKQMLTTEALVIRDMNIGEADKLLTLLSKEYGVIRAFASGVKNMKNKKFSGCSPLSYSSFTLVKAGDTYKIREAACLNSFFSAGRDVVAFALSQYFCELAAFLAPSEIPAGEFLRLMLNSLHFLVNKKMSVTLLKAVTELRMTSLAGYTPDLVACAGCACYQDEHMVFDVQTGELFCRDCARGSSYEKAVSPTVLTTLRHIVYAPFEKLYRFSIPERDACALAGITGAYTQLHAEHRFTTLDFFESVL